ncbi:hypothetical protein J2S55_008358 [Streptosporangium brasiliense]|uniref:Uncharacterized protein n=1 Tax=Streptosporangium brasiliense TaxID=47480 RepID=A0ABT9RJS5_9ACTN|nr:hypothetical protein [Streptosporangium brasiliense]
MPGVRRGGGVSTIAYATATVVRLQQRPAESVRGSVEQLATPLVGTGLPRMPARVSVCLLTSGSGELGAGAREPHAPG